MLSSIMMIIIVVSDLRLEDGECETQGRLEVYHDGEWGTVCGKVFDEIEANVSTAIWCKSYKVYIYWGADKVLRLRGQ